MANPQLSLMHPADASAEHFWTSLVIENSLGSGAKGFQYGISFRRVQQHHRTRMRLRFTEFLQDLQSSLSLSVARGAEDKHVDFLADRLGQKTCAGQIGTDNLRSEERRGG